LQISLDGNFLFFLPVQEILAPSGTMISTVSTFIRRNIVVVLAVPPVIAAAFGIYAKLIRQPPQPSAPSSAEHTLNTEKS